MSDHKDGMKISIHWVILVCIPLIGGVFALTKYANYERVELLNAQLAAKNEEIERIKSTTTIDVNNTEVVTDIPVKKLSEKVEDPALRELSLRVNELEKERRNLITKISELAVSSLDPRSEIPDLLGNIYSDDLHIASESIETLFRIGDPITFKPLADYFLSDPEKATNYKIQKVGEWFKFFLYVDREAGFELITSQIASPIDNISDYAEFFIDLHVKSLNDIDIILPLLEELALTDDSEIIRGKAKAHIQRLENMKTSL